MDLYRIEKFEELDQLGWEDMVYSDAVTFIEWPEKLEPALKHYWKICIELDGQVRKIELNKKNNLK